MSPRLPVLAALLVVAWAAPLRAQNGVAWHGYTQLRYSYGSNVQGFAVRRAKLWIEGATPVEGLRFRVQGLFRPGSAGTLVLQDAYAEYRWGFGSVRAGQMVPDFSLERSQPDYAIPLIERAGVINTLIPATSAMLARDIGAEVLVGSVGAPWHLSAGVFNGDGANHPISKDRNHLLTARATYTATLPGKVSWEFGASGAFRHAEGIVFSDILGVATPFTGTDARWGAETRLTASRWALQGEFLHAKLDSASARGWYALGAYAVNHRDEIVVSAEALAVPGTATGGEPWCTLGFNHFLDGDRAKIMLDGRAQFAEPRTNYATALQVQLFFR